jgi:hypothetical protein
VWEEFDGQDWEIFLYTGSEVLKITDNFSDDRFPEISAGWVVWEGHDGHDYEIYLYRPSSVCAGDLDRDGDVDLEDFSILSREWGRSDCIESKLGCPCDLNADGRCNILDYQLFFQGWHRTDCLAL